METKFKAGDRVRLSPQGLAVSLYPKRTQSEMRGTVIGSGLEYDNTVRVKWNGSKHVDTLSDDFIELEVVGQ